MGCASTDHAAGRTDEVLIVEVTRHEARSQAKTAGRLHHENREVPTAATAMLERYERRLHAFLLAHNVPELLPDRRGHRRQRFERSSPWRAVQQASYPPVNPVFRIRIDALLRSAQIQCIVRGVAEGQA